MMFATKSDAKRCAAIYGNGKVFKVRTDEGTLYAATGPKRELNDALLSDLAAYCQCRVNAVEQLA